ncbi:MAG TPA: RIP metalloprotease RseP [Gammaproteobacteria bacterium]
MQIIISILAYVAAIGVLVTAHEFGHFIVARRLGIKVLRFSIGFGKPLYTWRRKGDETEYVLAALPLGGYVKMADEREGEVAPADLPRAFNRQRIPKRFAVVLAGPVFNFLFAILAYWVIFMAGVPGIRPVVGDIKPGSAAAAAGFEARDVITAVAGHETATWDTVQLELFREVLRGGPIAMQVTTPAGESRALEVQVQDVHALTEPGMLLTGLGLAPWVPPIPAVVGELTPDGTAAASGLKSGDRVLSVAGKPVSDWQSLVQVIRDSPGRTLALVVERDGRSQELALKVGSADVDGVSVGRVGAGFARLPDSFYDSLTVEQRYNPPAALWQGIKRTADMSWLTLVAGWNMLIGNVSLKNLSGPIDIAQYAGYAAESGLTTFLEFLAFVSVSLGVLNLLPIPVLDGGHLLYFSVEAAKGSPLSERMEVLGQRIGIVLLLTLMVFVIYNDLIRVLS